MKKEQNKAKVNIKKLSEDEIEYSVVNVVDKDSFNKSIYDATATQLRNAQVYKKKVAALKDLEKKLPEMIPTLDAYFKKFKIADAIEERAGSMNILLETYFFKTDKEKELQKLKDSLNSMVKDLQDGGISTEEITSEDKKTSFDDNIKEIKKLLK